MRSMMPEQRKQKNERQWHSEHPKQNTSSETHINLLRFAAILGVGPLVKRSA
jgi:hypothetical protein